VAGRLVERGRARVSAITDTSVRKRRRVHYRAILQVGREAGIADPLRARLAELLDQA
jgi:hypothetical protein